jgi:hypothetical protein
MQDQATVVTDVGGVPGRAPLFEEPAYPTLFVTKRENFPQQNGLETCGLE